MAIKQDAPFPPSFVGVYGRASSEAKPMTLQTLWTDTIKTKEDIHAYYECMLQGAALIRQPADHRSAGHGFRSHANKAEGCCNSGMATSGF
jgi:hypothetical protein